MAVTKSLGSAKRLGARYGKTVKERLAKVEKELRKKHKCPYCNKDKVKRVASGIWLCRGCHAKFTGKAYSPTERILTKKVKEEEVVEVVEEQPKEERAQKFKIKKPKQAERDQEQIDINEPAQEDSESDAQDDSDEPQEEEPAEKEEE